MTTCNQCGGLIPSHDGECIAGTMCICRTNTCASDNVRKDQQYNCPPRSNEIVRVEQLTVDNARLRAERDTFKVIAEVATETVKDMREEKSWGCGHTNHGSCSQCLGHVTNERNELLRKTEELQKANHELKVSYVVQDPWSNADRIKELEAALVKARDALKGVERFICDHSELYPETETDFKVMHAITSICDVLDKKEEK